MTRKRHILAIAGLLGLSCLVQAVVVRRATVTALDAVRFVGIAQQIDGQGLLPAIRSQREEPLFPAWVWVVHGSLYLARGEFPSIWAASAQLAAAIPLVLAVVPLYLALMRMVGAAAALAGSCFFCLLPEVSRLGADGISDSTHLLFFCVAFWAMVEYFRVQGSGGRDQGSGFRVQDSGAEGVGRPTWLLLAGVATGTAVLARAEALVLGLALGLALAVFQFLPARRQAWRGLAAAAACFVLGLAIVLGPYLAVIGSASPRAAVDRVLGRHQVEKQSSQAAGSDEAAVWQMTGGEPTSFDVKQRNVSTRRRGYAAAVRLFGKKLADAFGYWIGALALFGAWRLRRGPASKADRFVQVFFLLFSLAVIQFTAAEGYLAPRHLLVLVAVGIGRAGYGALELGSWMASRMGVRGEGRGTRSPLTPHPSSLAPHARPAAVGQTRPATAWMPVVLAAVACLPQTLVRHHHSRLGHRGAGRWLVEQADAAGSVLDTRGWSGLYSGRKTYPYEQGPAALSDPHLAYVVVEKAELGYENRRSRTLRWLLNAAAEPTSLRAAAEFPHAAVRKPNQQPVVVYRWHPRRFARTAAGSTKIPPMKEDRHARANPSVRR